MAGETVLVVDDHPNIIELIQESFQLRGYRVITAGSGQDALAKVYQELPDLILLDIMMPMFSGYEICRTLKSSPETQHIPIIFITAKGNSKDIEKGFEMRADGYIVKPFEPAELADFAEQILKNAQAACPAPPASRAALWPHKGGKTP